jgi:glycine/D-amino acid oxidase-like deaminating enzyme
MTGPSIAVVGAGILGCLVAREIVTREPGARVVVLDRDGIGSGASRRSAGLHFPRGASERVRRMSAYSEDYYERLRASGPVPIYPLAMTIVARTASTAALHETYLDRAKLITVDRVAGAAVRIPDDAGAWTGEGCQYADVSALAQELARDLRPRVSFREGVAVTGIEPRTDGVDVLLGTGETVPFDWVVLAPGPWVAAPAWRGLVAPLGVRVKKIVALHIEDRPDEREPAIVFHDEDAFLLPMAHRGHWLFSYTCQEWDVDPDALRGGLTGDHLAMARHVLARYAPSLTGRATSGRVFCDAYSRDRQPVVRALDDGGRVVFAGAANGSGYRLAPAIAAEAADLLALSTV